MRHVRFDLASVALDRVDVPLKAGYLLVVAAGDGDDPQWEVLAYALDPARFDQRLHRVDLSTLDGRHLRGEAALVRSVEGAHVLRGAGPLLGFDPAELSGDGDGDGAPVAGGG